MFDSIPHDGRARALTPAQTKIYGECAEALGITPAAFGRQVDLERAAGRQDDDAINSAYLHIADPDFDRGVPGGASPADALAAAAFRRGPRRQRDAGRRRGGALARCGSDSGWQDQVLPAYRHRLPVPADTQVAERVRRRGISEVAALAELRAKRLRELAIDAAAWALYPGTRHRERKARSAYRVQMRARYGVEATPQRVFAEEMHGQMAFAGAGWGVAA